MPLNPPYAMNSPASVESDDARHERLIEQLIDRLPGRIQSTVRWLRLPSSQWVRIPAGMLFVCGGVLSILPILGLWMLPVGLVLLAEDIAVLRRARDRMLDWIEERKPHWVHGAAR
jgi:hypothetical protein